MHKWHLVGSIDPKITLMSSNERENLSTNGPKTREEKNKEKVSERERERMKRERQWEEE